LPTRGILCVSATWREWFEDSITLIVDGLEDDDHAKSPRRKDVPGRSRQPLLGISRAQTLALLSAPHHVASVKPGLFPDPFLMWAPLRPATRFRCAHTFFRRNSRLPALTPILAVTLIRQLCRETRSFPSAPTSPTNSITARISMKTITKPRKPFFPSCIMDLGALFSLERGACATLWPARPDTLNILMSDSCARSLSLSCRSPRLDTSSSRRPSGGYIGPTPCCLSDFCCSSVTGLEFVGMLCGMSRGVLPPTGFQFRRSRFWPQERKAPNEPNPTIGQSPAAANSPKGVSIESRTLAEPNRHIILVTPETIRVV